MPALIVLAGILALLWPTEVHAEPLTLSALITLGVSAEVAAAWAGTITAAIIGGLSIALSFAFAPDVPKPPAGRTTFRQPVPPRIRIISKRRSAGAQMLYHSYQGSTFHGVTAVCEGKVKEFSRFWLHDDAVEVIGNTVQGIESSSANRYGDGKVRIFYRYGKTVETAYTPANSPPFKSDLVVRDIWTSDMRGDGIASVLTLASDAGVDQQAQRFPFGIPVTSAEVDATKVYDPRSAGYGPSSWGSGKGSMASGGTQDWRHSNTWSFAGNDNPILQAMWFVTAPIKDGGMGLDFEECFSTVLQQCADQADVCDEAVPLKGGGSEKRYRSAVYYKFNDPPSDVLAAILGTCDGFLAERGDGAFELKAGKWDAEDFEIVIRDKHILSLNVRRFRPDEDEVTGVIVKYTSVPHDYTEIDAPVWPRDAYQGGEDRRVRPIEITYCPSGTQAQRLSKRVATYEMAPISGTMVLKMYGVLLLDRRGCSIQCSDDPALADCRARLRRVEPNLMNGTVEVDFTLFDPAVCDAWDAPTEEGPLQPVVTVPVDDARSIPTNLVVAAEDLGGGDINIDVEFDPGGSPGSEYDARQRVADTGGGVPGPWRQERITGAAIIKPEDARWIVVIRNPIINTSVEVQVRPPSSAAWSASAFVDSTAPGPGLVFNLGSALSGADVVVSWRSPSSPNFDHARVYRALHGGGFGSAVDISGAVAGAPNTNQNYTDVAPGSGNYDYYVSAETAANLSSLTQGPTNTVVP